MLDLVALIFVVTVNLLFILLVLSRNAKNVTNRLYALMIVLLNIWTITNYFTNHVSVYEQQLFLNRLSFASALVLVASVWLFSVHFPYKTSEHRLQRYAVVGLTVPIFILTLFTSLMVEAVEYDKVKEVTNIISGPLYPIYTLSVVVILLFLVKNFFTAYRSKDANTLAKQQISYTAIGVIFTFVWSLVTTTIWPQLTGNWEVSKFGIVGSIFLGSFVGVAIVRHKLFDIRLVVARTMGYLLSVGALALLYGLISFGVISVALPDTASVNTQRFTYTLLAVVLAFTFQPLKRFFDRWSNKLFYRDAYDSQELLNQLNTVLVSTIELEKLLGNSANVIGSTLKADFCMFGIKEIGRSPQRIVGTTSKEFSGTDITAVRSVTPKLKIKTIVADELDEAHVKLKEVMRKNDIAVMVRLTDTPTKNQEGLGYMILGAKKSGSPYTQQDIRVLEIIADELVIAIQNALRFEEIKNFNVTLQEKVDDATKKLRKANQRLIELDQTKDDFISMASHQLRTPLTSVKGYISMVMEGDVGKVSKKQNELLDQAFVSAQRMVYLIADLLNVSRLRTGKFIIEPKETNLADIIEGEISQLKETAKGRNLELTYDKPKDFPTLMLDETKIRQVIMNFADNAIYYTPTGGHIKVGLEDKGDTIEFTVSDDGIGVPKLEQHHLFNKFYRANNAKKTRPDGTGLGLFMAKKVVVAQGGSIIFNSQEGKGSTFGFSFTKKQLLPENFKGIAQQAEKDAS